MTLLQLNYLHEVVKQGSINQAAKTLFSSQSGISNAIRELEDELGIIIFSRHSKGVHLTLDGQVFYDEVYPILLQEQKIFMQYQNNKADAPLKLSINSLHYPFVAQSIIAFISTIDREKYEICYKESNIRSILKDVGAQKSDLGVIFLSGATKDFIGDALKELSLTFHPLKTIAPHVFLRENHPLTKSESLAVNDLEEYPYAVFEMEYYSLNYAEELALPDFHRPDKVINLTDRCMVYNLLRHTDAYSIGTGILPEGFCDPHIVAIPISNPKDFIQLGYIQSKGRKLSKPAALFLDILRETLSANK